LPSATPDRVAVSTPVLHKNKRDPEENRGSTEQLIDRQEDPFNRCVEMNHRLHRSSNVMPLLRPGSFVMLENQPDDLPPFELIQCRGGRCWVRQQAWGQAVQWEVEHERLRTA